MRKSRFSEVQSVAIPEVFRDLFVPTPALLRRRPIGRGQSRMINTLIGPKPASSPLSRLERSRVAADAFACQVPAVCMKE